ncbi:MAG: ABC transporter permease subunit [Deltaproteobacteria bacterium]|nr:ABC transporter permease subunit [Deltaproteobacteria bacterium]
MSGAVTVFRKELRGFFFSPIAYIVITTFLLLSGWFFFSTFFLYNQAELRNFFSQLPIIFAFIVPAVTMRLFSEELNTGSFELLSTLPVTDSSIVVGKFLASLLFIALMLLPTIAYAFSAALLGDLDWGPVCGGYFGSLLLAGAYAGIGLFASSLTKNQIIAFILGMALCFMLTIFDRMLFFVPESILSVVAYLGSTTHFQNISRGIVDTRDLLYFLSIIFLALYATSFVLKEKR